MDTLCIRCKGKGLCKKPCKILAKFQDKAPKVKTHFSGNSPPEIFVGRIGYPFINSGILAPATHENTTALASPEQWVSQDLSIEQILEMRGQLIYGRAKSHIKSYSNKLKQTTQELALSSKPVSTEVFLKKAPTLNFTASKFFQIITNPAPIKKANLEENPSIPKKVDYLTSDYNVKATTALAELYNSPKTITTTHMQKLLSAGLLGTKNKRKMVPTRWSITAVDDTLGKQLLEKVRYYQELNQIQLFHQDYNGNHFEALLLPEKFSFEIIEVAVKGSLWQEEVGAEQDVFMQDFEGFFPRKTYASHVVGAYYADRLVVSEYLDKIKKQAAIFMCHEERPEYYAPLGVGIIRESLRKMFNQNKPEFPESIEQALIIMGQRLHAPISRYKKMSWILANYKKQKRLKEFF